MNCLVGVDVGTTSTKAVVDERRQVCGAAAEEYPTRYVGDGGAEQDPDHWWAAAALPHSARRRDRENLGVEPHVAERDVVASGAVDVGEDASSTGTGMRAARLAATQYSTCTAANETFWARLTRIGAHGTQQRQIDVGARPRRGSAFSRRSPSPWSPCPTSCSAKSAPATSTSWQRR